jgi:hypothetical protein
MGGGALMACGDCPNVVPVVSEALAHQIVSRLDKQQAIPAELAALQWLVTRHEGLAIYWGIHGRPYTHFEQDAIALETEAASGLPCPFYEVPQGCLLNGLGPYFNRVSETGHQHYGWLPTMVARLLCRDTFRDLVAHQQIADVKVAFLSRNEFFMSKELIGKT